MDYCFKFLEEKYDDLAEDCMFAEKDLVESNFKGSISIIGSVAESITNIIFKKENIDDLYYTQDDKIKILRQDRIIAEPIRSSLNYIRKKRNKVLHNRGKVRPKDIKNAFRRLYEVTTWFYKEYEDKNFEIPEYNGPIYKINITPEETYSKNQINELKETNSKNSKNKNKLEKDISENSVNLNKIQDKLNESQAEAAYYDGNNPLVIEAGPGSGKTHVLIERVKFLLEKKKVKPESLLVITFTRKAANELKERLSNDNIPKSDIEKMQISTIHGFCSKIMESNGKVGLKILDDDLGEKTNLFIDSNLKELGFVNEAYIPKREIRDIVKKYNEYSTFNVNTEKLVEYIKKTHPISSEYIEFVNNYINENETFPREEVRNNPDYKKSWYNAKYLQIAKSYPRYLELLNSKNATDFPNMQRKTLEYLEENPKTQYRNILIDEFQDTDPVQARMFEILMNTADSFTVVGDINQSIYGFRGSTENYFEKLFNDDVKKVDLNINYRSTNQIIDFSEKYIKNQDTTSRDKLIGKRNLNREIYYLDNDDKNEEAENILNTIKYLYDNKIIENYNEIGILSRSVKVNNCIGPLIKLLKENNIPYEIKGLNNLLEKPEVKSLLTLYYHLIRDDNPHSHIFNRWESDWLNLKAYTGENFKQKFIDLSEDTKDKLNNIEEEFEENAVKCLNEVMKEKTGKKGRIRKFSGIFNKDDELVIEVFNRIKRPILSNENLEKYKITNKKDLEFFHKLNELRNRVQSEDYKERPRILDVFFELLTETTNYLNPDFIQDSNNEIELKNISLISESLHNYEEVKYSKDVKGAFWFLYHNIDQYESAANSKNGIQIGTIHKSKGLEFPVVILASLSVDKFPKEYKNSNPKSGYIAGHPVYYTPNDCLGYKSFKNEEEEIKEHNNEEDRIVYVGLTRAQDILILSSLINSKKSKKTRIMELEEKLDYCKGLKENKEKIKKTICEKPELKEDLIDLSFTSLRDYTDCPFKYRLLHYFDFKISNTKRINEGILIHSAFEIINKKIKLNNNKYIGDDEVESIIRTIYDNVDIKLKTKKEENKNQKLGRIIENIKYYYNNVAKDFEIIDSEVNFNIKTDNYNLDGTIDLIFKMPNGEIGILDYKNTFSERKYIKEYENQVYTYLLALRERGDYNIKRLYIYAIKSKKLVEIGIDEDKINKLTEKIDKIASNIEDDKYPNISGKHCKTCKFLDICKNTNKENINTKYYKDYLDVDFDYNYMEKVEKYNEEIADNLDNIEISLNLYKKDLININEFVSLSNLKNVNNLEKYLILYKSNQIDLDKFLELSNNN